MHLNGLFLIFNQKKNCCSFLRYKLVVADAVIAHFDPIRLRILDYLKHPEHISTIIKNGGEKARETAEKTLQDVKAKVGLNVI